MIKFNIKINHTLYLTISICILCFENYVNCLEAPHITIPGQGIIVGTYLKMFRAQNIKAYLGIRYAHALRFSPPDLDMSEWRGVQNATKFAPLCWQNPSYAKNTVVHELLRNKVAEDHDITYDEDCLYLNIFVPDGSPGLKGYAVVFWIHAGDFSNGAPTDIEPFQVVFKQKIIVVTFSYRLNIFGFLSTADGEAQGNYGLMDQSAALFWVKKNINHFGGDENRITIMGHSAGAISVGLHLISEEWSRGGFSGAIMMSGNPISDDAVRDPKFYKYPLDSISNLFGCTRKPTSLLLACLRKVDAKTLAKNIPEVEWGPVIDYGLSNTSSPFIRDHPRKMFQEGNFQNVPILIGVTDMEDTLSLVDDITDTKFTDNDFFRAINEVSKRDLKMSTENDENCTNSQIIIDAITYIYPSQGDIKTFLSFHTDRMYIAPLFFMADIISKDNNVFAYLFSTRPQTKLLNLPEWVGVPKFFDQIFVWGVPYMNNNLLKEWNSSDKKISDVVMTMWANFAKSANPIISNVYVKWNSYKAENSTVLIIDQNFNSEVVNKMFSVRFWNNYYPELVKFAANCCDAANSASSNNNNEFPLIALRNLGMVFRILAFCLFLVTHNIYI
ncbi:PREDICTED: cholinesterase [Rhagoletis zephyria]|uniref:cholinesterase n=1 Tax=Rhagoletis zephyria TaxID=28612 RepID=UPI0008112EE3|nr:PREDICTED: cholinesterase [Rhagoletis zephyria]